MPTMSKPDPNEILKVEFGYIADTVFQANEDRSRVASYYFVTVGSLVAAILGSIFSTEANELRNVSFAFSGLFVMLTALGALTVAQLARLRAAWHESAEAMNQIKEFYIKHNKGIEPAFKWRAGTLPPTDKPYSIANLMAAEVIFLSSITLAAAVYFLLIATRGSIDWWGWVLLVVTLLVGGFILRAWYKRRLVDDQ